MKRVKRYLTRKIQNFLLFDNKRQVELLWNGKSDEVTNVVLPFQVIEQVDEPRSEKPMTMQEDLFDFSGRQINFNLDK